MLRQFRVSCVAGLPELFIRAQLVEMSQRDNRIDILSRLVPRFVSEKSQRERRTPVDGQFHRVVEMAIQGLQDGERVIHGVSATGVVHTQSV